MSNRARPLLLGYIRVDVLSNGTALPQAEAQIQTFADREEFSLGTVYVQQGDAPGAFHALMAEVTRDEAAVGVVVPDLRHLTVVEQLILSSYEAGASMAVLAADDSPVLAAWRGLPRLAPGLPSTGPVRGPRTVDP